MLAQRCFDLINIPSPPFNICNLESSYMLDEDIPNLPKKLEQHITRELLYACRYWGAHFQLSKGPHALHLALHSFLSTRLLLWMEIMNLNLDLFSLGASMLYRLKSLAGNQGYDAELRELTKDAYDFVNTYTSSPASHSTPHIYISTLAFWPKQKPLSKYYSGRILCPVEPPDQTAGKSNSSTPPFIYGFEDSIRCTSFSPDSARVACGFDDGTVRTSCAYTGEMMVVLSGGHNKTVHSVMYASDGGRLVSGSEDGTVIIWDVDLDQMIGESLRGHTGPVYSVSYSPTNDSVASGSADSTIRIWDIQSSPVASKCLEGHTGPVFAIAHSPGGEFVVSGSSDRTIRIWNIDTCQTIGESLYGHTEPICSITYSADGESIISGAVDGTIYIWDAQSGQMLAAPFVQHADAIFSTILLPGGRKFISRLDDDTIGVWDVSKKVAAPADDDYTYLHSLGDEAEQRRDAPLVRRVAYPRFDNALGLGFCSAFDDEGWLVAGSSRLVWVPPNIRDFLWHPQGEVIVSDQLFSNMSVGDKWQQCYQPALQRSNSTTRPPVTLCDTHNLWSIQGLKVVFFDKNGRRKHKKQGEGFRH
ncbi:hypothetical protein FRC12_010026 [Ceratobasidium sp. 428]|nr:hypothetical protein FRC12_010026 [Ceratobasidium sp. 428]